MRTLPMPAVVHETTSLESTLEILDECCKILHDYREAGCPRFPKSDAYSFVNRLMSIGVTCEEAVEQLKITLDNFEEVA